MRGRGREWKGISRCTTTSRHDVVAAVRLPMDIIEGEILCRLPVKSLLRCKSVCKLWYSIIKNPKPKFIKTHHHHHNNTTHPLFLQLYRYGHRLPVVFNPSAKKDYSIWPIPMVVNQNQNQNQNRGYTVVLGGGGEGDQDWRIINAALPKQFVSSYINHPSYGVFMNGKYYWLSKDLAHILVFDIDEEVFQEMNSPIPSKYLPSYEIPMRRLNVVCSEMRCPVTERNSLALFVFEPDFVVISVMDKEEEWHWISYEISYIDRPVHDLFNLNLLQLQELLQSTITEAILLKAGQNSFVLYNPKTNCVVRFEDLSGGADTYTDVSVFNFKESLFSMDGGIQVSDRVLEDFYTF